jgi:phage/plasmid-associated DNA primase
MKQTNKPIKRFMKKCCLLAPNAEYPAVELYLTYVNWCLNEGTDVHDQFSFLEMLEETGLGYAQGKKGCWFQGISVLPTYRIE